MQKWGRDGIYVAIKLSRVGRSTIQRAAPFFRNQPVDLCEFSSVERFVLFAGAAAVVTSAGGHGFDAHLRGPSFVIEPPSRVEFSNSSGAWLDCTATGSPPPNIDWSTADGHPVNDVPGVRRVLRNGTLVLLPFPAAAFRQDVHSAAYRCVASNSVGRVLSRDVQVRAGKKITGNGSDGIESFSIQWNEEAI